MAASVVIPAFRAASTVAHTVRAARAIPGVAEVIVVDDGSPDQTARAAEQAGADRVISLPRNRGKGAALRAGLQAARHESILFLDADLGESAVLARKLLAALGGQPGGMVVAALPAAPGAGGLGLARWLTQTTIRLLTGLRAAAPMSGQRALSASLARHAGLASRFAVEAGLTVENAHLGLPLAEISLPLQHHPTGRTASGFLHRGRQFKDVLLFLLFTGYGLGWPALGPARTAGRVALWLCGFALLICLGLAPVREVALPLGIVSAAALAFWLPVLWVSAVTLGLRKPNYLRRPVPAGAGLLFPLIALPALWLFPLGPELRLSAVVAITALAAAGLLDDLFAGRRQARGLRGHLRALLRGRLTTGSVKALAGLAAGLAAGAILHPGRPLAIATDALLIALSANFVNLLDLRPSRGLKAFAFLAALAILISRDGVHLLGPLLAAAIVIAPSDFAGRAMMGDVGANVLGGAAGLALVTALGQWDRLAAVLLLLALHLVCERHSLSDLVARFRLLSFLDRMGTAHLAPLPAAEEPAK